MTQDEDFRKKIIEEYKQSVLPLLKYLPWFEQHRGQETATVFRGQGIQENSLSFPVYDAMLMRFLKEAGSTTLMDRNYRYVYTKKHLDSHDAERDLIRNASWREWDLLKGIFSRYVMGGRTKPALWSEGVKENIFFLVLTKMKEIIEYWDMPLDKQMMFAAADMHGLR